MRENWACGSSCRYDRATAGDIQSPSCFLVSLLTPHARSASTAPFFMLWVPKREACVGVKPQHSTRACRNRVLRVSADIGVGLLVAGMNTWRPRTTLFLRGTKRWGDFTPAFRRNRRWLHNSLRVLRSIIGIHDGVDCLFFRNGSNSSTPLMQAALVHSRLVQKEVGIARESWPRVPSARTQATPCFRHSQAPPPRAIAQRAAKIISVTCCFHHSAATPHLAVMAWMNTSAAGGLFRTVDTTALAAERASRVIRTLPSSGSVSPSARRRLIALLAALTHVLARGCSRCTLTRKPSAILSDSSAAVIDFS